MKTEAPRSAGPAPPAPSSRAASSPTSVREQTWSDEETRKGGVADHLVGHSLCPLISCGCVCYIQFSLGRPVDVPVWYHCHAWGVVACHTYAATPTPRAKRSPHLFAHLPISRDLWERVLDRRLVLDREPNRSSTRHGRACSRSQDRVGSRALSS